MHCILYVLVRSVGKPAEPSKERAERMKKIKTYKYGMKVGYTPTNHPKVGLIACLEGDVLDDRPNEKFHGYVCVLFYARELSDEEVKEFDLEKIE